MNYYEELGVGRDAPAEEIRQAYKTLARMLHPDSQADEKLKAMAGRQMQRLNEVLGILTDPERRRAYDEGLAGRRAEVAIFRQREAPRSSVPRPVAPGGGEWVQSVVRYWFWVLMGAACAGTAAVWWALPLERNVIEAMPAHPGRAQVLETDAAQNLPKPDRSAPPALQAQRDPQPEQELPDPPARSQEAEPAFPDPVASAKVQPQAPEAPGKALEAPGKMLEAPGNALEAPAESGARAAEKSDGSPFAGSWLYLPQAGETTDLGEYPAVYIEFLVAEERGDLVGSYRARYKVPDKAISPEIALQIRGRAVEGQSTRAEWTSSSGAKGVLEMTLRAPGLMNAAWWTTEFAPQPQLTSGSALLVRQQAP